MRYPVKPFMWNIDYVIWAYRDKAKARRRHLRYAAYIYLGYMAFCIVVSLRILAHWLWS